MPRNASSTTARPAGSASSTVRVRRSVASSRATAASRRSLPTTTEASSISSSMAFRTTSVTGSVTSTSMRTVPVERRRVEVGAQRQVVAGGDDGAREAVGVGVGHPPRLATADCAARGTHHYPSVPHDGEVLRRGRPRQCHRRRHHARRRRLPRRVGDREGRDDPDRRATGPTCCTTPWARPSETSGGSAANTVAGVASFGGRAAFIGTVRDDQLGEIFRHDIRACGVDYDVPSGIEGPSTARCLILVTPDAQRSMSTYLGHLVPGRPRQRGRGPRRRQQGRLLRGLPLGHAPDHRSHQEGVRPGPGRRRQDRLRSVRRLLRRPPPGRLPAVWSTSGSTCSSPTPRRSARSTRSTTSRRPSRRCAAGARWRR